jgi:large subunit ribosomal protein L10
MATPEKIKVVEEYTEKFKNAKSVFLADYTGMDVATVTEIRRRCREANVEYRVLKNRLAKRALNAAGVDALDYHLKGVTTFVIGYEDPVTPAKVIKEFNKSKELLKLKVVYFEGRLFDAGQASALANLPTREALMSKVLGLFQAPMTKFAGTLKAPMQNLVGVLNSLKESKS